MAPNRYARQILFFGEAGQAKLAAAQVGIVGLGGLGSQVAQALAYLGVGSFMLVDDDWVEDTNLNRLIGATPADAAAQTRKVAIAQRLIGHINPEAQVRAIPNNLRTRQALEALTDCPVIFGCVDHDGPRLVLMELAAAYRAVLVDLATEINPDNDPAAVFGGLVVVCPPGEFCLACAGEIDRERAKQELEAPLVRAVRRAHGYGLGEQGEAAAVVALNGVVANLAATEFMMLVTGIRPPNQHLIYRGMAGSVKLRQGQRQPDCYTCGYLAGIGPAADIFRYVVPDDQENALA